MILPPPRSTRTDTLVPSPTLFRSRWVGGVSRRPVLVVLLCLAVSVGLAWLAAVTLTINTSTDDMLSKELPFRAQNEAVDEAFPQLVEIGRAQVGNPVTNAHLVCRLLLTKKKNKTN